jgi:hypothetical protein
MILGFFIGLALWSAVFIYERNVQTALQETDYGAAAASFVILAGNSAFVGYLVERFAA